jgi:hypothetical protein
MALTPRHHAHRIFTYIQRAFNLLFQPDDSRLSRFIGGFWFAALYLVGGVTWSFFLNWGRLGFDLHDWTQEGPRYTFLRQALLENRLPLHIGSPLASTERFLAIPDTIISPQVLLLRFLEPGMFVLLNTLFLYSLGFLGLLALRRRLNWSPVAFTVVALLFSLNGYPLAHVAVGHSMWISYFLLPFFAYLVLDLLEGKSGWKWVAQMALLQFALFLQGGYHFVTWSLLFLFLLGVVFTRYLAPVLKAILFSLLVNLPRILPTALEFSGQDRRFISGFFSVTDLVAALTSLKAPEEALSGMYSALGWWEVDVYVGLLGLAFLLFFGVTLTLKPADREGSYGSLLAPVFVMTVLSLGKIFQPVTLLPIPLLSAERVSSRFVILPVVMVLTLAGIQFDRFLRTRRLSFGSQLAVLLAVAILAHDLLQHARLWRVENMALLFQRMPVDIRAQVLSRSDPPYVAALLIGLSAAVLAFLFLGIKANQDRGRNKYTAK